MKSLMPLLLIVLSIGLFYTFISPHYENVQMLSTQANQYEDALKKSEELRVVRDNLLTEYNSLPRADIDRLMRIVPDSLDGVKLVADIDAVAGRHGITVSEVKISEDTSSNPQGIVDVADAKPYLSTSIAFKFTSTYSNLTKFLGDLEKSLQVVDVKSLSFTSGKSKNDLYTYDIAIQTYNLK